MSLRFTSSQDGALRATVRVETRVSLEEIAAAYAIQAETYGADSHSDHMGRVDFERLLRAFLADHGPPSAWPLDYSQDDYASALDRLDALWPNVSSEDHAQFDALAEKRRERAA